MFPSNTGGFGTGTVILRSSSTCVFWISAFSSWMRQSGELYCSEESVFVADCTRSWGTKAGVLTSSREGNGSEILVVVLETLAFASSGWGGVVTGNCLSCLLALSRLLVSACGWIRELGAVSFGCLCFSVGSTEFDASCKVMVSFSSDSCSNFWIASAAESSPCSFSCSSKRSSSLCCFFNSSRRLSISWSLFRESNFAFSFAVSIAARFEEEVEDDRTDDGGFLECCDLCERSSTLSISWSFILTLMSAKHSNAASFNPTYRSCSLCSLSSCPNLISRSIKFSCTVLNLSSAACKPSLQALSFTRSAGSRKDS